MSDRLCSSFKSRLISSSSRPWFEVLDGVWWAASDQINYYQQALNFQNPSLQHAPFFFFSFSILPALSSCPYC
jgi:hypothetical protein